MQAVQPKFVATKTEVQTIILNWVQATEDFHHYYCQVNEAINALNPDKRSRSGKANSTGNPRANLQALTKLRQYMSDVLMTLLTDMSKPELLSGRDDTPSRPGRLTSHTRLLQDINRKVYDEVKHLALTQA